LIFLNGFDVNNRELTWHPLHLSRLSTTKHDQVPQISREHLITGGACSTLVDGLRTIDPGQIPGELLQLVSGDLLNQRVFDISHSMEIGMAIKPSPNEAIASPS
jgi:hypothetical protein